MLKNAKQRSARQVGNLCWNKAGNPQGAIQLLSFWTSSTGMWLNLVKVRLSRSRGHQS